MSKYMIEIEDEPFVRLSALFGEEGLYRAKGLKSLVFDQFGLDKLTPLDKALSSELGEAYQKGFEAGQHEATTLEYQQGLDDAWDLAKRIVLTKTDANCPYFTVAELEKIFGRSTSHSVFDTYSVTEAIEKLKAYEEQQKADEIKVGDEVEAYSGRAIVFGTFTDKKGNKFCRYWYPSDDSFNKNKTENLKRTGRHFPQVAELLKVMKEGAE